MMAHNVDCQPSAGDGTLSKGCAKKIKGETGMSIVQSQNYMPFFSKKRSNYFCCLLQSVVYMILFAFCAITVCPSGYQGNYFSTLIFVSISYLKQLHTFSGSGK